MQKYFDNVVNRVGDVIPDASVYVTVTATGAAATLYSDDGVTTKANPTFTDNSGHFFFYAADGVYTLTISGSGIQPLTIPGVLLEDGEVTQPGSGAVARTLQAKALEQVSVDDYFVAGMADDTLAMQRAVTAVGAGGVVNMHRDCTISSATVALQVSARNVTISGGKKRATLTYTGAGVAIALGTDDGLDWDAGNYDGDAQGFTLDKVALSCTNSGAAGQPRTALLNSITGRYYGTGTYGIRDWRGGKVRLVASQIEGFEYGLWGVQSDLNYGQDLTLSYNHVGVFLGPRSDQARFDHIWSFGNDTVFIVEGACQTNVTHWTTDTDGSGTTAVVIIRNSTPSLSARYATTRVQANNVFDVPWIEQLGSFAGGANPGYDVNYVFDVNVGDATQGGGFVIRNPFVVTQLQSDATKVHFFYLVRAGHVKSVEVTGCSGKPGQIPWSNTKAIFYVDAASAATPRLFFTDADVSSANLVENFHASTVFVQARSDGFTSGYSSNQHGGTGAVALGLLGLHRALRGNNTPMSSGTTGDITLNRVFEGGKSLGWAWTGAAAVAVHAPTIGTDRGDAAVTLTPETDHEEQIFSTALTADRDCVLAAPAVAANGYRFCITRGAGAFNLNVKNLTSGGTLLKAMPADSSATFFYNGTNWILRAYGLL